MALHSLLVYLLVIGLSVCNCFHHSGDISSSSNKQQILVHVNVAIFYDKKFNVTHQNDLIDDYFAIQFWDISSRFKTLQTIAVSFAITSVSLVNSTELEKIIDNKTSPKVNATAAWEDFSSWTYEIPNFDIAVLVIQDELDPPNGYSHKEGKACKTSQSARKHFGTIVVSSRDFAIDASRQLAFLLGAEIDQSISTCHDFGYLMNLTTPSFTVGNHFFSTCTDKYIQIYQSETQKNDGCFKEFQSPNFNTFTFDPDFDDAVIDKSIEQQCKDRLPYPDSTIESEGQFQCDNVKCFSSIGKTVLQFSPIENTPCGNGERCYGGRCLESGQLMVNISSGLCLQAENRFQLEDSLISVNCPRSSRPTEKWRFISGEDGTMQVMTSYISLNDTRIGDKCLRIGEENVLVVGKCSGDMSIWKKIHLENDEFLLKHSLTNQYLRQEGLGVILEAKSDDDDDDDESFRWGLQSVYAAQNQCNDELACVADLKITEFFKGLPYLENLLVSSNEHKIVLEVNLTNHGDPAMSPAVIITWDDVALILKPIPHKCFSLRQIENVTVSVKCKLGRLLKNEEEAIMASLEFKISEREINSLKHNTTFQFNISSKTASKSKTTYGKSQSIPLPFQIDLKIAGNSSVSRLASPGNSTITFTHMYEISKESLFPLKYATAVFYFPIQYTFTDGSNVQFQYPQLATQLATQLFNDGGENFGIFYCLETDQMTTNSSMALDETSNAKLRILARRYNISSQLTISCGTPNVKCTEMICKLNNVQRQTKYSLPVTIEVDTTEFKLRNYTSLRFVTKAELRVPENVTRFLSTKNRIGLALPQETEIDLGIFEVLNQSSIKWMILVLTIVLVAIIVVVAFVIYKIQRKLKENENHGLWTRLIKRLGSQRSPGPTRYLSETENPPLPPIPPPPVLFPNSTDDQEPEHIYEEVNYEMCRSNLMYDKDDYVCPSSSLCTSEKDLHVSQKLLRPYANYYVRDGKLKISTAAYHEQ